MCEARLVLGRGDLLAYCFTKSVARLHDDNGPNTVITG